MQQLRRLDNSMENRVIDIILNRLDKIETKADDRFTKIEEKVDKLLQFKFQIVGGTILASLILTGLFHLALALIERGN